MQGYLQLQDRLQERSHHLNGSNDPPRLPGVSFHSLEGPCKAHPWQAGFWESETNNVNYGLLWLPVVPGYHFCWFSGAARKGRSFNPEREPQVSPVFWHLLVHYGLKAAQGIQGHDLVLVRKARQNKGFFWTRGEASKPVPRRHLQRNSQTRGTTCWYLDSQVAIAFSVTVAGFWG